MVEKGDKLFSDIRTVRASLIEIYHLRQPQPL